MAARQGSRISVLVAAETKAEASNLVTLNRDFIASLRAPNSICCPDSADILLHGWKEDVPGFLRGNVFDYILLYENMTPPDDVTTALIPMIGIGTRVMGIFSGKNPSEMVDPPNNSGGDERCRLNIR